MGRAWVLALAFMCAGCLGWTDEDAAYFSSLNMAPAAVDIDAPAALPRSAPAAAAVEAAAAALASEDLLEADFLCADGARLHVSYSPDRRSAVAQWSDGARHELQRADEAGLIRYASLDGELLRAGPRISWSSGARAGRGGDPGAREVRVEPGDTLWKISERVYGVRTRGLDIARANVDRIADPNLLYPGQMLRLPDAAAPAATTSRRLCMGLSALSTPPLRQAR